MIVGILGKQCSFVHILTDGDTEQPLPGQDFMDTARRGADFISNKTKEIAGMITSLGGGGGGEKETVSSSSSAQSPSQNVKAIRFFFFYFNPLFPDAHYSERRAKLASGTHGLN